MKTADEIRQMVVDFSDEILPEIDTVCNTLPWKNACKTSYIRDKVLDLLEFTQTLDI